MTAEDFLRTRRSLRLHDDGEGCSAKNYHEGRFGWFECFSSDDCTSELDEIAKWLENQAVEEKVCLKNRVLPILLKIQSELPGVPSFFKKNPIDNPVIAIS